MTKTQFAVVLFSLGFSVLSLAIHLLYIKEICWSEILITLVIHISWLSQQDLTNVSYEKLENYLLILSAIEQNLVESKKIEEEIIQVT